jgi:hypothetical protein
LRAIAIAAFPLPLPGIRIKRRKGKELERRAGIWIGKKDRNRY